MADDDRLSITNDSKELSGTAKKRSDNESGSRFLISPGYEVNNNDSNGPHVFLACPDSVNTLISYAQMGGVSDAPANQGENESSTSPQEVSGISRAEVDKFPVPDVYANSLMLNQLLLQNILNNQTQQGLQLNAVPVESCKSARSQTGSNPDEVKQNVVTVKHVKKEKREKPKKAKSKSREPTGTKQSYDSYQAALEELFGDDSKTSKSVSSKAPSQQYSDISSEDEVSEESESSESECESSTSESSEEEPDRDIQKKKNTHKIMNPDSERDNINMLQTMKTFIDSSGKTGPKINDDLAKVMNKGLRSKITEDKVQDLMKKYDRPANVESVGVPRINKGLWNQMSLRNKDVDVKLQRIQNLLSKTACPLIYLMDMFLKKSSKNEGMTKSEVQSYAETCRDAYQLFQTAFSEITFRRRAFIRSDIDPQYKSLCDDDMEVTDKLFGDDLKEKVKDLDAENSICKKISKHAGKKGESARSGRKQSGGRHTHKGGRKSGGKKSFKRKYTEYVDNYSHKKPRYDDDFLDKRPAAKKKPKGKRLM